MIAHRGDWRNAPENSIQCIENAIEMGVDMVEIDIQPTKDRNFICMHDETLERTSTGVGAIKDYTTEELKKLVLRSGNGIKTRRQIPTLEEVLKVCKTEFLSILTRVKIHQRNPPHYQKMRHGKASHYQREIPR